MAEKSVRRAIQLLEILADSDTPLGVSELSRRLEWTKSGTYRLLQAFIEMGYARQIGTSQLYQLSNKLLQIASRSVQRLDLRRASLDYLRELLSLTGETSRLSILAGDQAVCIEQFESSHPVTVQTQVGGVLHLGISSTGKAILAFREPELIERVAATIRPFNELTLSTRERLLDELALVRERGFAVNRGEQHLSVSGVAAPIHDRYGRVEAAIGVSGPSSRLTLDLMMRHGPLIKRIADTLSEEMGWSADRREMINGAESVAEDTESRPPMVSKRKAGASINIARPARSRSRGGST